MGHAISNLALRVGQSFLCRREGVGHVFFINHISKCSGPPPLYFLTSPLNHSLYFLKLPKQIWAYRLIFYREFPVFPRKWTGNYPASLYYFRYISCASNEKNPSKTPAIETFSGWLSLRRDREFQEQFIGAGAS